MARKRDNGPGGLIIVDKPAGFTSHDVVAKLRGMARTRRVGHAGTLDPMATGVLVIGTERATRLLGHLALTEKEYVATVRLGQETVTEDAEGEITAARGAKDLDRERVEAAVATLTGQISQVPSTVSAVKVDGRRAYARVREGEEVELAARPVTVSSFVVHDVREETAEDGTPVTDLLVSVVCSSGTYVRALARDLGAALGTGGHLTALRRTRVGPYGLDGAHTLERLQEYVDAEEPLPVLPLGEAAAAAFSRWDVGEEQARRIGNGVQLRMPSDAVGPGPVAVFGPGGQFVALVEERGGRAKSLAVFV
ncbi:tRNA pseudouridine(55) synthase TruB [Streptomyces sp. 891-h]|uniref:tRNA pseudouridine(55) synthase TruB n=1 Tax=unclassified Streptomyces TaxID=2593676 RepID=UPI001FA9F895|nr:tRNA pseudouridine(55) synthase TruB [Streptomyces sp. 891-h]UNZ17069.1 tRNA pseudouridine(55) synthase TruB [Streptomyces sp. 891-h]